MGMERVKGEINLKKGGESRRDSSDLQVKF